MSFKRKIPIFIFCFAFFLFLSSFVLALEIKYPKVPGMEETPKECLELPSEKKLGCYLKYLYHFLISISGLVCFGSIVFGGILFLISGGSVEKIKSAKEKISGGFLGILVLLSTYLIVFILNPELTVLKIRPLEKITIPTVEPYVPEKPEKPVYVKVPLGRLIERTRMYGELANKMARSTWLLAAEHENDEKSKRNTSIRELTECLKKLTEECKCEGVTTREGSCSLGGGNSCSGGECPDPCDRDIRTDFCKDIDESLGNLCGQNRNKCNLREVIEEKSEKLEKMTKRLERMREILGRIRISLANENNRLKLAETLLENAVSSKLFNPVLNYYSYLAIEEENRKEKTIWGFNDLPINIEFPHPPECCTNPGDDPSWCARERTPSCIQCPCLPNEDCDFILFCFGRPYVGSEEIGCETDSRIPTAGEIAGQGGWVWQSPGTYPEGFVLYNGVEFPVPSGGVVTCNTIAGGCANDRCLKTIVEKNDPATFYVPEEENEELIRTIETLTFESIAPPSFPPPYPFPPPLAPDGFLNTPQFLQTDPRWADINLDNCDDTPMRSTGCGPTSAAIILRYFGWDVDPAEIATNLTNKEARCGIGSSSYGLAEMMKRDYGLSYHLSNSLNFEDIQNAISAGYPIMTGCKNFANWGVGHITVIRGIDENNIYFQDTIYGRVAYPRETVRDVFGCTHFYTFSIPSPSPPPGFIEVLCTIQNPSSNEGVNPWGNFGNFYQQAINEEKDLIYIEGPVDPGAPRLQTLLGRRPDIKQVYVLNEEHRQPPHPEASYSVHLIGLDVSLGEQIKVPSSGYSLGGDYEVVIIYADKNHLTLKYTREDNVVWGYTIHIENISVDSNLLAKYKDYESCRGNIRFLPAYKEGEVLGTTNGNELIVGIRDTGAWMDPRAKNHWWQGLEE